MTIYHTTYRPSEHNKTRIEVLFTDLLMIKLSVNERTQQAEAHMMGDVERLSAFKFESAGKQLLSITARTSDGGSADLIIPLTDLNKFIAELTRIQDDKVVWG